jgi:ribose/xylose/arabinose/galactoside ABC-type transport system permease subunit
MSLKRFDFTKYTSLIGLALLLLASSILSPAFLKPVNIHNIIRQVVPNGIAACGMTLVILTGGIDLSVGSLFALIGVSTAMLLPVMPWPAVFVVVMLLGGVLGCLVGLAITKLNVPPFIVTLAGYASYRGIAMAITNSANIFMDNKSFVTVLGSGRVPKELVFICLVLFMLWSAFPFVLRLRNTKYGKLKECRTLILCTAGSAYVAYIVQSIGFLNIQIVYYIIVLIISIFILDRTVLGRQIYAVGDNYKVARMTGIKADLTIIKVYMVMTILSAFAGILIAAKLQSGVPALGVGAEFDAITAVVIGGTSLSGGVGKLQSTIIGVLLIGVLNNLLSLLNVSADLQNIFKGAIILLAVVIDTKFKKR